MNPLPALRVQRPHLLRRFHESTRPLRWAATLEISAPMQIRAALSMIRAHRDITRRALAYSLGFSRARNLCSGTATGESGPSRSAGIETASEEKAGMTTTNQYDIAIVGGGMVGLAFACALTSMPLTKQLSVAIIDSNPALQKPLKKVENHLKKDDIPDPRVSTVTPATISFFKDIGAWEHVQEQRHAFFDKMQVWDYTGLGFTRYNAKDVGKDYLGCVVENKVLCNSLLSCLQNTDLDNTIYTARLISMVFESQNPSGKTLINQADSTRTSSAVPPFDNIGEEKLHGRSTKLELSDGRTLYAKLVVGADGAKSRVREIAGLKTTGWNYSQSAIICTVEHEVENHCAWQRFLPSGPIALLPVGNKFSNIVWTMSPEGSSIHKSMSADEFIKAVNHALDYGYGSHPQPSFLDRFVDGLTFTRQGAPSTTEGFQVPPKVIKVATERLAFPLSLMHARDYVSKRVALIGDAAHNVHPLAGQGVNLGFGDASALSKVISEGLLVGTDIGELSVLKRYEKERKAANITMMAILDGFQKAYSVDFGPVKLLRAAALHGAQYIPPLKRNIISFAMGDHKFPLFS